MPPFLVNYFPKHTLLALALGLLAACPLFAQVETHTGSFFELHYSDAHAEDARIVAAQLEDARALLENYFGVAATTRLLDPVDCSVLLHPQAQYPLEPGRVLLESGIRHDRPFADVHLLAHSAYPPKARDNSEKELDNQRSLLLGKLATVLLERYVNDKGSSWSLGQSPAWFQAGYPTYLAYVLGGNVAIFDDFAAQARHDKVLNPKSGAIHNDLLAGTLMVKYLHEQYGAEQLRVFLQSTGSFDQCFIEAFDMHPNGLARKVAYELFYNR